MAVMSTPLSQVFADGLTTLQEPFTALPTAAALIVAALVYLTKFRSKKSADICELGGLSIFTAWPFFNKRYDFLKSNFAKTGQELFSFKVLQHSVVAMKGVVARKAFFDSRGLGFLEGYSILMGGAPRLTDIDAPIENPDNISFFNKQLLTVLHRDRLAHVLPDLFDNIQARFERLGRKGRMDPFRDLYDIVFQLTVHMASCRELATNLEVMKQVQHDFWVIEKSSTPTTLLLPWFPSPKKRQKIHSTKNLYVTLRGYVDDRVKVASGSDAIDVLLAGGISPDDVVSVILGIIFAGTVNTGVNACWSLLFLTFHASWREKVTAEVKTFLKIHANIDDSYPIHQRLASIPMSAWEEELPTLDLVLRETLRLTMNSAALRRNIGPTVDMAGKRIPKGYFLTYPFFDVHHDPDIYSNPSQFDPARFMPGREEDKNAPYAYLAWGVGRHPCPGMRVAKLEMKIILVFFLAAYEYDVVDSQGKFPARLPRPNYNDIHMVRPIGDPCYIDFERVLE